MYFECIEDLDAVEFEDALDLHSTKGKQLEKRQKTAGGKKKAGRTRGGAKSTLCRGVVPAGTIYMYMYI